MLNTKPLVKVFFFFNILLEKNQNIFVKLFFFQQTLSRKCSTSSLKSLLNYLLFRASRDCGTKQWTLVSHRILRLFQGALSNTFCNVSVLIRIFPPMSFGLIITVRNLFSTFFEWTKLKQIIFFSRKLFNNELFYFRLKNHFVMFYFWFVFNHAGVLRT